MRSRARGCRSHRVVNRNGELTGVPHFETHTAMKERLPSEGAPPFAPDGFVEPGHCRWDPKEEMAESEEDELVEPAYSGASITCPS